VLVTSKIITSDEVNWAIGSLAKHLPAWISYIKCEFLHFNGTYAKRRKSKLTSISRAIGYFDWSSAKLLGPVGPDCSALACRLPCWRHLKTGKKEGNDDVTKIQKDVAFGSVRKKLRTRSQNGCNSK
jgi:hypothetical protein